jgi:dihydroorotate dehydrogenase
MTSGFSGLVLKVSMTLTKKLLPFMSHDRITLAGTMISIGVIYAGLGRYGLAQGLHWSKTALMVSGLVGFSSFLLYLGYAYFDPLHGLVAAVLLPMFLIAMHTQANRPALEPPNMTNNRAWYLAQWGQLMFVILGFALAVGGATISMVGITHVFVATDLVYLGMTPDHLANHNEHFMPLIAHDRAGFGGALFSNALAILTTSLWGINQGQRWLWWTFLLGGLPGFAAGLSVHAAIGYSDFWHLLPAYFAFIIYVLGLILLYPYLMERGTRGKRQAILA